MRKTGGNGPALVGRVPVLPPAMPLILPSGNGAGSLTTTDDSSDSVSGESLEGRMDLDVVLPNGNTVRMAVERRTPMMDLLVHVTKSNGLSPGSHVLDLRADQGRSRDLLPYKPSTAIGSLNTSVVHIVPKASNGKDPSAKREAPSNGVVTNGTAAPQTNNQPFEKTFRLQVHLPYNQLHVLRVSSAARLLDIFEKVCAEKGLGSNKYELRHPVHVEERLDPNRSLADYNLSEVAIVSLKSAATMSRSTTDILSSVRHEESRQHRSRGGFFGFFKRSKSNIDDVSSEDPSSRGNSPSPVVRSGTMSYRSESPAQPVVMRERTVNGGPKPRPATMHAGSRLSLASSTKTKRPAPPPPTVPNRPSSEPVPAQPPKSISESLPTSAAVVPVVVSHSRHSSDSSGYHEASVLSEALEHEGGPVYLNGIHPVMNGHRDSPTNLISVRSTSMMSVASSANKNKRKAPAPPPRSKTPVVIESAEIRPESARTKPLSARPDVVQVRPESAPQVRLQSAPQVRPDSAMRSDSAKSSISSEHSTSPELTDDGLKDEGGGANRKGSISSSDSSTEQPSPQTRKDDSDSSTDGPEEISTQHDLTPKALESEPTPVTPEPPPSVLVLGNGPGESDELAMSSLDSSSYIPIADFRKLQTGTESDDVSEISEQDVGLQTNFETDDETGEGRNLAEEAADYEESSSPRQIQQDVKLSRDYLKEQTPDIDGVVLTLKTKSKKAKTVSKVQVTSSSSSESSHEEETPVRNVQSEIQKAFAEISAEVSDGKATNETEKEPEEPTEDVIPDWEYKLPEPPSPFRNPPVLEDLAKKTETNSEIGSEKRLETIEKRRSSSESSSSSSEDRESVFEETVPDASLEAAQALKAPESFADSVRECESREATRCESLANSVASLDLTNLSDIDESTLSTEVIEEQVKRLEEAIKKKKEEDEARKQTVSQARPVSFMITTYSSRSEDIYSSKLAKSESFKSSTLPSHGKQTFVNTSHNNANRSNSFQVKSGFNSLGRSESVRVENDDKGYQKPAEPVKPKPWTAPRVITSKAVNMPWKEMKRQPPIVEVKVNETPKQEMKTADVKIAEKPKETVKETKPEEPKIVTPSEPESLPSIPDDPERLQQEYLKLQQQYLQWQQQLVSNQALLQQKQHSVPDAQSLDMLQKMLTATTVLAAQVGVTTAALPVTTELPVTEETRKAESGVQTSSLRPVSVCIGAWQQKAEDTKPNVRSRIHSFNRSRETETENKVTKVILKPTQEPERSPTKPNVKQTQQPERSPTLIRSVKPSVKQTQEPERSPMLIGPVKPNVPRPSSYAFGMKPSPVVTGFVRNPAAGDARVNERPVPKADKPKFSSSTSEPLINFTTKSATLPKTSSPPPPPMEPLEDHARSATLKAPRKVVENNVRLSRSTSQPLGDSREILMDAIRGFGGRSGLKKVSAAEIRWQHRHGAIHT